MIFLKMSPRIYGKVGSTRSSLKSMRRSYKINLRTDCGQLHWCRTILAVINWKSNSLKSKKRIEWRRQSRRQQALHMPPPSVNIFLMYKKKKIFVHEINISISMFPNRHARQARNISFRGKWNFVNFDVQHLIGNKIHLQIKFLV